MKFEKHFKTAGTHGRIVKRSEAETWLCCNGVGMRIPVGVTPIGIVDDPDDLFNAIVTSESDDDALHLVSAVLPVADGKASEIVRIFATDLDDKIGIMNAHYGLLERRDVLTYLEIEKDDETTVKIMVIRDHAGDAVGFITGVENH